MYTYYFMLYLAESLTGRSYTEGKLLRYFPLWREGKGRKLCLLSANSYGIWEGVKQNVFFLQSVRMQKLINGSMQNVFLSGERGGPSKMVESRFLYVAIRESKRMLHIAFFIKTFLIHSPTTYLQPVYVAKESMQHVFLSGERGGPS